MTIELSKAALSSRAGDIIKARREAITETEAKFCSAMDNAMIAASRLDGKQYEAVRDALLSVIHEINPNLSLLKGSFPARRAPIAVTFRDSPKSEE